MQIPDHQPSLRCSGQPAGDAIIEQRNHLGGDAIIAAIKGGERTFAFPHAAAGLHDAVVTDDPEILMEIYHEIPGAMPVYLVRADENADAILTGLEALDTP